MKTEFRKSFVKDIEKIKDLKLLHKIKKVIVEIENSPSLKEIHNLKKLSSRKNCYSIRIGEYRMGFIAEKNKITFVRFLHRKEIYRYFP